MSFHFSPKAKENHESWESLFRQTLSKERLFTSTRPAENPIHWIQLLDPFDQHDTRKLCKSTATHSDLAGNEDFPRSGHLSADKSLQSKLPEAVAALAQAAAKVSGESRFGGSINVPGWPLIPFSKVQTIKCEKCCLEFCSPINHRRHLRTIHRRTSHAEKEDLQSQRQQLATFWDKLSPEEAFKIAAVKNLGVEDLTGEKVVRALSHLLQQPSLFALPHSYAKSGAMLLELVQSRLSRIFLTSSELFKILDGSSEKTFPSFGLSAMQKYVFEGGAGKIGLETKNLVASLSFLVEHNLVKAFIKNKDEEAWRCQTALVEEEEASRRKQAQIQAKKDMKKVRQKDKEQKASVVAMRRPSDIDLSDDETSSSRHLAGLQTRPSSNTFENLNNQLAGEVEFDQYLSVVSNAVSSPSEKSLMLVDSNDEAVSTVVTSACENSLVVVNSKDEVVLTAVSSPCAKGLELGNLNDLARVADEVGVASKALEAETKNSSNLPGTHKGSLWEASDVQQPYIFQKHKYHADRSLSVRGDASLFPYQKQSWKERRSLSARNVLKQTSANEDKEDMGLSSSCFLEATERDPSANKVVGIRPKQYVAKPLRLRNYQAAAKVGASIWTKKKGKCADIPSAKIPHHIELASDTNFELSDADPVVSADLNAGVSSTAAPHDHESGSLLIPSTTIFSNVEPSPCAASSEEQATSKTSCCNHEGSQAALFVADSGQCYEGGATIAPVVIGSVVIGSLDVSLESMVDQEEPILTASSWRESAEASKIELAGPVDPIERPIEKIEALTENGKNICGSHRDCKRDGNASKFFLQSGAERKENKDHSVSQAGMGNFMKPSVLQDGIFVGPKIKVWRPVVSNPHCDSGIDEISILDVSTPDLVHKAPLSQSLVTSGGFNNIGSKELERDQAVQENINSIYTLTSAQTETVAEGSTAYEADCTSTAVRAVAFFLSKRWADALSSSDSVILSAEAEEGGARQLGVTIVDVQRRDFDVDSKEVSRNPMPHLNKGVNNLPGNATKAYGLWKQGCSGSAMAVNRRMMGKENSHFPSRYANYRYVPK